MGFGDMLKKAASKGMEMAGGALEKGKEMAAAFLWVLDFSYHRHGMITGLMFLFSSLIWKKCASFA